MIDIHTHILPGVDDGAQDIAESVAMLQMAADDGTTVVVLTPHLNLQYNFDPCQAEGAITQLQAHTDRIKLYSGCELLVTPENLERVFACAGLYTIADGKSLLIELPDDFAPELTLGIIQRLLEAGLQPVVAHPERNRVLQRNYKSLGDLVEAGAYLQVTGQSLLGGFGSVAGSVSDYLLRHGLAHCIASDAHSPYQRRPLLSAAYRKTCELIGEDCAERLFKRNPLAILAGRPVEPLPVRRRSIWSFLSGSPASEPRVRP